MDTRSKDGKFMPKVYESVVAQAQQQVEQLRPNKPESEEQALKTKWPEAMTQELTAFSRNKTWALVPYKVGMNVVGSKLM